MVHGETYLDYKVGLTFTSQRGVLINPFANATHMRIRVWTHIHILSSKVLRHTYM